MTHGWVDSPDTRGTIDIVWSCLGTLFLCSWGVLCLNVPAASDGYWRILGRKLRWMCLAIYGPEFILTSAMGQWYPARASVRAFRLLGHEEWTLRHAFFADMGGVALAMPDGALAPVNAYQLLYLVKEGYTPMPQIPLQAINDKDKANGFARLIVVLQTVWFVSKCIGRAAQGLAITTFELTTLAFVFCTLATFFCWRHKPLDVDTPIVLHISTIPTEPHQRHGSPDPERSAFSFWDLPDTEHVYYITTVLQHLGFGPPTAEHTRRYPTRLPNDRLPLTFDTPTFAVLLTLVSVYAAMHLAGWNFAFPSPTERVLWRISSSTMFGAIVVFWIIDRAAMWYHNSPLSIATTRDSSRSFHRIFSSNNTQLPANARLHALPPAGAAIEADVDVGVRKVQHYFSAIDSSPWMALTLGLIGMAYSVARLYLLIECFVGLRALPASAFEEVRWAQFLPHL
ncbi:hypothetical protein W97_07341 [Coniosporium apollinis CBS 100218]|uniref:Uncharacterized protein n=1 Tax=Coniosporium apollinis (strain CBS 100218) TaxID=1168221 RepID=R7Z211_CONA1|nr:uncharacterized protein W97_07341 [Coniosporium apollinis CBS 100218]EON68192.1 hypothetical protein W97_07341 [Coniosporium apollinis CBS 100218]